MRWRSSLSNRAFSMAMTAWAAKFCTSSICLSVKGRTSWRARAERADQVRCPLASGRSLTCASAQLDRTATVIGSRSVYASDAATSSDVDNGLCLIMRPRPVPRAGQRIGAHMQVRRNAMRGDRLKRVIATKE